MAQLSVSMHPKLSEYIIERLHRRKISTVIDFVLEDQEKLRIATDLSFKEIIDIKKYLIEQFGGFIKKSSNLLKLEQINVTFTKIKSLDDLLQGGLYPGQIYEICGISSSGKTQLCLTIASNIVLRSDNLVRYIDTKGDFFASRMEMILRNKTYKEKEIEKAMEQIRITSARNPYQLISILQHMTNVLKLENDFHTRALIIDSLPGIIFKFSKDPEFNFILNRLSSLCRFIANEFYIPIVIVNLITQWSSSCDKGNAHSKEEAQKVVKPTLGKYWLHVPSTRLLIEKLNNDYRKVTIWKSYQMKMDSACNVKLAAAGII
ncbi:hypothetical protein KPH14_007979 [Odynerus spinipes]|uniref:RecA family profile 1 domain-containing protein n=1 Tax=Odynerus spinipes TaxID=1348599 RepID=A0AAD9RK50_9HYME|nr:hypothetical protein KPH14_007979 [Odynerus spinipes]